MLRHIPKEFTPELLRLMRDMGHGEQLLISDANFPWRTAGGEHLSIPVDSIDSLLKDILYFFPLDQANPTAALVMESAVESGAFKKYQELLSKENNFTKLETVERFDFYKHAKKATGIVITADTTKGGNILITKGVVKSDEGRV